MRPTLSLEQKLATAWPVDRWCDLHVLVAVSGGPDSVALIRALERLKPAGRGRLSVAHFNHGQRGAAARRDGQFVAELCGSLDIECHTGKASLGECQAVADGREAALRAARYDFLLHTAETLGARMVATGHTADDQAETILHHILRGTGLRGLAGMPRARALSPAVTLLRPLLSLSRSDVLDYLSGLGQPYCTDETNGDRTFTRNRIRHELMPLLAREYSPTIVGALVRLGTLAGDAQSVIDAVVDLHCENCLVERDAGQVVIDCRRLGDQQRHLVREVLVRQWRCQGWPEQSMGWSQWNELAEMVFAEGGGTSTRHFPGAIEASRVGDELRLSAARQAPADSAARVDVDV